MSWMRGTKGIAALIGFLILVILVLVGVIASQAMKSKNAVPAAGRITEIVPPTRSIASETPIQTDNRTAKTPHTPTPKPTVAFTPEPTGTPTVESPAQRLTAMQLGHAVGPKNKIAVSITKDLKTLQAYCGGHQFQVAASIVSLWKSIHKRGHDDNLASVAHGFALEIQDYANKVGGGPDCKFQAELYDQMRYLGRTMKMVFAEESYTPTPAPTDAPAPTETPVPSAGITDDTYRMVADHPDLYLNDEVGWQCAVAKFLGPNENGENQIGCWEFTGVYDGSTGDGEVILTVPNRIDTDSILTGDMLVVEGTVDDPMSGTNAYGATLTWPQLDVVDITDEGPLGN